MSSERNEPLRLALGALQRGQLTDAVQHIAPTLSRAHVGPAELAQVVGALRDGFERARAPRAAITLLVYAGKATDAQRIKSDHPLDEARCAAAIGDHATAARAFERAGKLGQAALQLELAKDDRSARILWAELARHPGLASDPYTQGLVRYNLARACARQGDASAARRIVVESMHLLEEAADDFEARGQRERAFDCYQVLLALGKDGAFENLAEGYLNCIRILRKDNLRYYVLQYYEDFQQLAMERGELHAAATLFHECADFSRIQGMPYEAHHRLRAAEAHVAAAERSLAAGAAVELAENAYTSAVQAYNELGLYSRVRAIYGALAQLPLPDKRRARYARLETRLGPVPDDKPELVEFPDYLRMKTAYPEIWKLDVVEWEHAGDAAETMADAMIDRKLPEFVRRRALVCRLLHLAIGERPATTAELRMLASALGASEIYTALAPLERLATHEDADVRAECMRAARNLPFKRTFVMVARGIADEVDQVREAALESMTKLHIPHGLDPLSRIYRESTDDAVRQAALGTIGRIPTIEATELLIDVVRHASAAERQVARTLLVRAEHPETANLLRRAAADEDGPIRDVLQEVLRTRGGR